MCRCEGCGQASHYCDWTLLDLRNLTLSSSPLLFLENPYIEYNGPTELSLVFPTKSFLVSFTAVYVLTGGDQLRADSELKVTHATAGGESVSGEIALVNEDTRMYRISFQDALPGETNVTIVLDVPQFPRREISLTVKSFGGFLLLIACHQFTQHCCRFAAGPPHHTAH